MGKHAGVLRILLLTVLLAMGCGAAFADSRAPEREGLFMQSWNEAEALLRAGKAEEAYRLYAALLQSRPDHNGLLIGKARAALGTGRHDEALAIYDALRGRFPDDMRLFVENNQARAFAGKKEAVETVFTGRIVSAEYAQLPYFSGPQAERLQLHGKIGVGVIYDSNANQGPSSNRMSLGRYDVFIEDAKNKESMGGYAAARLDAGYRLSQTGPWWVVGGVDAYIRGYENSRLDKVKSREWQWGSANAGLRRLDDKNLLDLRIKAETFDYELHTRINALGPEITYARAVTPTFHLISQVNVDQRDYSRNTDRNGVYLSAAQYGRFFFGESGHEFAVGGRYKGGFADNNDYSYNGWEGTARFTFKLPYDFEASPFISFGQDYYKGPATALESRDRRDDRLSSGLELIYRINEAWSIESVYQYVDNDSNSNLYEYDQHVVSLGMAWRF